MTSRAARNALSNIAESPHGDDLIPELNKCLHILATVFPRILPDVFREMLQAYSGSSRLQVVVDQLIRHQDRWVKGRWRTTATETAVRATEAECDQLLISAEDEFRRASYVWAVKSTLSQEFKSLSKSTIKAVLAEENHSYTRARPTLQKLAAKSWRATFSALWARCRKSAENPSNHYMLEWACTDSDTATAVPTLKETGDLELDMELRETVIVPLLEKLKAEQEHQDWTAANALNEAEAKRAQALYECQCCFSDTAFEQMAPCDTNEHVICFQCIGRAVSEALFGQGWGRNIDHARGQVRCLAPTSQEGCDGCLGTAIVERAILQSKGGGETWRKMDARLAEEALSKARLPLVNCPFCTYAEVDELYLPPTMIRYRLNVADLRGNLILLLITFDFLPMLLFYVFICRLALFRTLPTLSTMFSISLARLSRTNHLSRRFQCRSPRCGLPSCLSCFKIWRDPHICHESATVSLRTTVEAARTAALKRTCPRCGLAFIKDSGCNKLSCTCGYTMCYICRQGLGKGEGGEGYRHFCQHFRPLGGMCNECDKCDLYKNLDDEGSIADAGIKAEKEWREREGMVGVGGLGGNQEEAKEEVWLQHDWTMQALLDWWVAKMITC